MSLASCSARRPVAVAMLFLAIGMAGLVSAFRLPIDLLPDLAYPRLVVYTTWPEAAPREVERLVTEPVERAAGRVAGVEQVESVSREGASLVALRFAWGTDMDFAALAVREQLDDLRGVLPERADRPAVLRTDPTAGPVLTVALTGADLHTLRDLGRSVFARRLEQIDGIAQAVATGGLEREIQVEVDPLLLDAYGLELADIAAALAAANASVPGGTVRRGRHRYPLRTVGALETVDDIGDITVAADQPVVGASETAQRSAVRVADVATITDGWREPTGLTRFDGREAVALLLYEESGANTVRVTREVERVLVELRAQYPQLRFAVATSQARFVAASVSSVTHALLLGAVLAFLVLLAFLNDARYPVAVALSIPVSVAATFAAMDALGVTLNIMSLAGLALGVGMLLDNSIVVLDSIERRRELGDDTTRAAVVGTEEVQGAVVAVTLTTIAVFLPLAYVDGMAGALLRDVAITVSMALLASLAVALTLLPALAARWSRRPTRASARAASLRRLDRVADWHQRTLAAALERPTRVLALTAGALALAALVAFTLDRSLLPPVDEGALELRLEMPPGTPLERTSRVAATLEQTLLGDAAVEAVLTHVGTREASERMDERRSGPGTATLAVRLRAGSSTAPLLERLGAALYRGAGAATLTVAAGSESPLAGLLAAGEADLTLRVHGAGAGAAAYAERVRATLAREPSLADVRLGVARTQAEVQLRIDRDAVARYGLDAARVAAAFEAWTLGSHATSLVDFDRLVPVRVRLPPAARRSLAALQLLRVDGVPLTELVKAETVAAPVELMRRDQVAVVPVLADVRSGGTAAAAQTVRRVLADYPPPAGMRVESGGAAAEMRRGFASIAVAFVASILLVYMIIAAQLESYLHPLVIMATVPLATIGAIGALWLTRAGLNAMSLIGIVILVGIVVDNAIVEVDFIGRARAAGAPLRGAILQSARARLRPILMTSATTILGTLPLALGIGSGAALRAPMGIAVVGGVAVGTALTLVVVPVLYERVEHWRGRS